MLNVKYVNSVTYSHNYVTLIVLRMFTFVKELSIMNIGKDKSVEVEKL